MGNARFIIGDVFDGLASLGAGSVDLVMTSPPFLALRSYLPADHPDKAKEIGSEATPGEFIDTMLDVVEACARVLAPHGSICFELGDTYAGSGGAGGDYNEGGLRDGQPKFKAPDGYRDADAKTRRVATPEYGSRSVRAFPRDRVQGGGNGWPLDKSKTMIPQLFAIALAYGVNPLTGRQTEPWRIRNTVAWCRPNPPVGRDGDKFRPATSFLTVACKGRDRYWDGDAVRVPGNSYDRAQGPNGTGAKSEAYAATGQTRGRLTEPHELVTNPAGAPLLDWWNIPTQPYREAHYATFPEALCVPVIKSMAPFKVCRTCGKPSTRITQRVGDAEWRETDSRESWTDTRQGNRLKTPSGPSGFTVQYGTLGWTDCGHNDWRLGVVLDPFAGSGTTLSVATGLGRDAIGIDLDARNADLARERCGMFLTVDSDPPAPQVVTVDASLLAEDVA